MMSKDNGQSDIPNLGNGDKQESAADDFEVEINGEMITVRKMSNGALQNVKDGRIVRAPTVPNFSDPVYAREVAKRRHEQAGERAREGLLAAAQSKGLAVASSTDAWGRVIEKRADTALTSKGRDGNDAAKFVGLATDFLPDRRLYRIEGEISHAHVHVDKDALLVDMFRRLYPDDPERALAEKLQYENDPAAWAQAREEIIDG